MPQDTNATATAAATVLVTNDVVALKGGVVYTPCYPQYESTRQGVTFTTANGWGTGRAIIDGWQNGGTSTNLCGFKLSGHGQKVDNLEIRNVLNAGVWASFNNHVIANCYIHTMGWMPWEASTTFGAGNGVFSQATTNTIVSSCLISNCNYGGIYFSGANDSIAIINNEICDVSVDAVGYGGTTYFLISGNLIHDAKSAVNHGDGMQLLGFQLNNPLVICNNTVWDCTQNIFPEPYANPIGSVSAGECWIFNNVVYNENPGFDGLQGYGNGIVVDNYSLTKGVYVFNNTMVDLNSGSGGLRLIQRSAASFMTNFWNVNNLFYNSYSSDIRPTNGITTLTSSHNLYTNEWRPQIDLATYQAIWPGWETNSVVAPMTFWSRLSRVYIPTSGPAIGGGTNLSALVSSTTFSMIPAEFRPDPSKDRNGTARGSVWDIGAYEGQTNVLQVPPSGAAQISGSVAFMGNIVLSVGIPLSSKFYGLTSAGGITNAGVPTGNGTAFTVTPEGIFTNIYIFPYLGHQEVPVGGFIRANDGMLYGVTQDGGDFSNGTLFRMTTTGTHSKIHDFLSATDGHFPNPTLLQASDGFMYGMCSSGGVGGGSLFKISTGGIFTTVRLFNNTANEGAAPYGTVIQASDGNLYGTCVSGGANGNGTVFKCTLGGVVSSVYSFSASGATDGRLPTGDLLQLSDGWMYGMARLGGANNQGLIFKITTTGTFQALHSMTFAEGATPTESLMIANDGNLYGVAGAGGSGAGTIFVMTTSGTLTKIHTMVAAVDGSTPMGPLVQGTDGWLYGCAMFGGPNNKGTIFRISTGGFFQRIHAFNGDNGASPSAARLLEIRS